ncbi:MAG: major capsid protein [Selenomonadaceae bacterium]|nr:major capsid protein [Selenomonadaceae bacterium]
MNPFLVTDTIELLPALEQLPLQANFLTKTFFPNVQQFTSDILAIEYLKNNRRLAPYVTKNSRGINMARERSKVKFYQAPIVGAKRVIGIDDISRRGFGETPIFSTKTPEERAAELQARDLRDLMLMIQARREQMCSELLQTNQIHVKSYADDGKLAATALVEFDGFGVIEPTVEWSDSEATILDDIRAVCDRIAAESNMLPTVMVCGSNVEQYLLRNVQLQNIFLVPDRATLNMLAFQPRYTSPQSRFIGVLSTFGLEIYSYNATYIDDETGEVKNFIDPNTVIIGVAGRGKMAYGRVDYLDMGGSWQSIAAPAVPCYTYNVESQTTSLAIYSRFLPVPEIISDFICLKVAS